MPAASHYGKRVNEIKVYCDRCRREIIECCVGHEDNDLCMPCVEAIAKAWVNALQAQENPSTSQVQTLMVQSMFSRPPAHMLRNPMLTRMMPDMFTPSRNPGQGQ